VESHFDTWAVFLRKQTYQTLANIVKVLLFVSSSSPEESNNGQVKVNIACSSPYWKIHTG